MSAPEDGPRRPGPRTRRRVTVIEGGVSRRRPDDVATEEPLELRALDGAGTRTVAITMRTPGADFELAAGLLHGEGVVHRRDDIAGISFCVDAELDEAQRYNVVNVALRPGLVADLAPLERRGTITSACGVCGKASLDALAVRADPVPATDGPRLDPAMLLALPERLRAAQRVFDRTGGLHAAGLFTADGELLVAREDVGRHNAVDKVLGWALLDGRLPLADAVLCVSGRTSYEILQKAVVAGVPVVCAVSAPSSLAVDLAERFGVTLAGFVRGERMVVYAGEERLGLP